MALILRALEISWELLLDASAYVLLGVAIAGMIKVFLSTELVVRHLGRGRFLPVLKASLMGIPLPLCSCGVLPAAAALKRQGASKGATTSFLISTPETGVDSMLLTYALMGPVMTVARPLAAFVAAMVAGLSESWLAGRGEALDPADPQEPLPAPPPTLLGKLRLGWGYAFGELWGDIAVYFLGGVLLAGLVTALVPEEIMGQYLGGGLPAMLIMLVAGIPLYICATSSTPIAAALMLNGVSPGVALVFLLAGPATNISALTVLSKVLGRRSLLIYLSAISGVAVLSGLALDAVYNSLGISAQATMGEATELLPPWIEWIAALSLLAISARPLYRALAARLPRRLQVEPAQVEPGGCGAGGSTCSCEEGPAGS